MRDRIRAALASAPVALAASFILRCIAALPAPLLSPIGGSVFLDAARAEIPDATSTLLEVARPAQRTTLERLGMLRNDSRLIQSLLHTALSAQALTAQSDSRSGPSIAPLPHAEPPEANPDGSTGDATTAASIAAVAPTAATPGSYASKSSLGGECTSRCMIDASQAATTNGAALCEKIRTRFGLGLDAELGADGRAALGQLRAVTTRSIQRLSAELYSGDAHFLLELIQNADDNTFNAHAIPKLQISLDAGSLSFHCNEVGFSEANVLALCSIGESTKLAADSGSIGNKGIGCVPPLCSAAYANRLVYSAGGASRPLDV